MNRENLAKKFGVEKLQELFVREFFNGKNEAEIAVKDYYENAVKNIEDFEIHEAKYIFCLTELIDMKNTLSNTNYIDFAKLLIEGKSYKLSFEFKINSELDEVNNIANYFLDYHDFKKSTNFHVESQLALIKEKSLFYHSMFGLYSKSKFYFDVLNEMKLIDDFNWDWSSFEKGLKLMLKNHAIEMLSIKSDANLEIERYKLKCESRVENLKNDYERTIRDLNFKIETNKIQLKFNSDYYDKFYNQTPIIFYETYFGDNLPFITELYKFLKKCNLFNYGFSYFYSCLLTNSNELINLSSDKKNNFIGRIFYRLTEFLIKDYKDNSFKFFQSKFFINNQLISDNFKANHMKIKYDEYLDNELIDIDKFFDKLSKIYIKY